MALDQAVVKEFLAYRLDPQAQRLWRLNAGQDAEIVPLPPRAFDVLCYLVDHPGKLVGHDELLAAVWREAQVLPEVLKTQVLIVRSALKDSAASPRYIETVRGRGYRFVAPVASSRVVKPAAEAVVQDGDTPFVGRDSPLEELHEAFRQATAGKRQLVFVSGEPGMGKSRLVARFLETNTDEPDRLIGSGRCVEVYGGSEPYYPILEALSDLCRGPAGGAFLDSLVGLAPMWASQMPARIPAELRSSLKQATVGADRGRMLREICELLEALATRQPLILILEDLHWADHASLDVIAALGQRPYRAKLMLLATYRPEDPATGRLPVKALSHELLVRKRAREVALEPLDVEAVGRLVGGANAHPAAAAASQLAHLIWERSGGNPLFMMATLDDLLERGMVTQVERGWISNTALAQVALAIPRTLGQLLEARIQQLSADQLRALEAASATGLTFCSTVTAVAAEMSQETFEDLCDELARRESFISRSEVRVFPGNATGQCYRFRHQLFRDALHDRQGPARQARLHRSLGERWERVLDRGERFLIALELAWHFEIAHEFPRALAYLRMALMTATRRFAHREAVTIIEHALKLARLLPGEEQVGVEVDFLERLATIYGATRDARAREAYQRLADLAAGGGLVDVQARALLGVAFATSWLDTERSLAHLQQALEISARQPDPQLKARTELGSHVWRIWIQGWDAAAARQGELAFEQLRRGTDPLITAVGQIEFGLVCLLSSRYRQAHEWIEGGYRALFGHGEVRPDFNMARAIWQTRLTAPWALLCLGELGRALEQFDFGITTFSQNANRYGSRTLQQVRAWTLFHCADFHGMLAQCHAIGADTESIHVSDAEQAVATETEFRRHLLLQGLAEAELGDLAASYQHLREAQRQMDDQPVMFDWYWRIMLDWGLANLALKAGEVARAQQQVETLLEGVERTAERTWQGLAWETHARIGLQRRDATGAMNSIKRALAATEGFETPLADWRIHATAALAFEAAGMLAESTQHARLGAAAKTRLAESLPQGPLRANLLAR